MKRLISQHEYKYMRFVALLVLTGICYYYRDDILYYYHSFEEHFLYYYGEAIGVNENQPVVELQDGVSSGDSLSLDPEGNWDVRETQAVMQQEELNDAESVTWKFVTGEEDYFDDALFIGDSRTVGLQEYADLTNATYYCATGLSVYKVFSSPFISVEGSMQKLTIEEALTKNTFEKIYLMLGINEMGTGDVDSFIQKYEEVVSKIQELQPDAIIYLQSIMKVSSERSSQEDYINNEGIDLRNAEIEKLADQKKIFYLNVNASVCDSNGALDAAYTFDGVHLKASYISLWKQYLLEHIVELGVK